MNAIREQSEAFVFIVSMTLGKEKCVNVTNLSLENIDATLFVLRKRYSKILDEFSILKIMIFNVNVTNIGDNFRESFHEQIASKNVQYHVVLILEIFSTSNTTLI
jgi:hypothetical protein